MIPSLSLSPLTFVSCSSSSFLPSFLQTGERRSGYHHRRRKSVSCRTTIDDTDSANEPNTRLRARVAYVGTRYHGWQLQQNSETIQGRLESVLTKRFRRLIRVVGASRTDTGVHARGQGVHFDVPLSCATFNPSGSMDVGRLQHSMNRMLPDDIRVSCMEVAPLSDKNPGYRWHAMYNSSGKCYSYRLSTRKVSDPLSSPYRFHVYDLSSFSLDRLSQACGLFTGTHDFAAFANKSPNFQITTVRTIRDITLSEESSGHLRLDFQIDGALYRMIRNVVGAMLAVAHGTLDSEDIPVIFASKDRQLAPMGAPACGLCLEHVYYDGWNQSAGCLSEALV